VVAATSPITYNSGTQTVAINQAAIAINAGQVATTVSDKSVNYTLVSADENTFIRSTGSAITVTVPDVLQIGERIDFLQDGAGQITFSASGVTIQSKGGKLKTAAQYSGVTLVKVASGQYRLIGDLG
jgi:hypothetical protein